MTTEPAVARSMKKALLPPWMVGEFFGTFLLVFFGCGVDATAITTGAQVGLFQVAIVWGLGIATAIHLTASLSGAHLNPAVTLAFATWSDFPKKRVLPYWLTQMAGAFVAAAVLYVIFSIPLAHFESSQHLVRGQSGSEASAAVFGEFFPNPEAKPLNTPGVMPMTQLSAFVIEMIGTAILLLVIFGVTDHKNKSHPQILTASIIGLTVTMLISLLSPLTMAAFNPARDLGPRTFSALAGWGTLPFTTNSLGWLTVYVVAPLCGALLGGALYRLFFARHYGEGLGAK
jgi:glycerol uptake facilitator protein